MAIVLALVATRGLVASWGRFWIMVAFRLLGAIESRTRQFVR
jgi:hypothetical protein